MQQFYSAHTSQKIDHHAIHTLGIPSLKLMKQAGLFAFQTLQSLLNTTHTTSPKTITVLCGTGHNGGDGFVLAQLAALAGYHVHVCLLGSANHLKDSAQTTYQEMRAIGISPIPFQEQLLQQSDYLIDAILGIGLNRPITGHIQTIIEQVNQSHCPVLALDIPSGLHADTGTILGCAIQAQHTCTFITQKIGLYSYQGTNTAGHVHYSPLGLDTLLTSSTSKFPPIAYNHSLKHWLTTRTPRLATHHKGLSGTACLIGGNHSMMGAIQLAANAALQASAGLIKVITRTAHTLPITQTLPEVQCYNHHQLNEQLSLAHAIAIGPGLGRDTWAQQSYQASLHSTQPKVLDADALYFLAHSPPSPNCSTQWILTPHPKEAATLLNCRTNAVQNDRICAIKALHKRYGGVIVLKGNGTLIFDGTRLEICLAGNAGMATGGMGDVLTGLITSFLAQGLSLWDAANLGVSLHAHSGDQLAQQKSQSGVIPTELALNIHSLL